MSSGFADYNHCAHHCILVWQSVQSVALVQAELQGWVIYKRCLSCWKGYEESFLNGTWNRTPQGASHDSGCRLRPLFPFPLPGCVSLPLTTYPRWVSWILPSLVSRMLSWSFLTHFRARASIMFIDVFALVRKLVFFSKAEPQTRGVMHREHLTSVPFPILLHFGNLSWAFIDSFQGLKFTSFLLPSHALIAGESFSVLEGHLPFLSPTHGALRLPKR